VLDNWVCSEGFACVCEEGTIDGVQKIQDAEYDIDGQILNSHWKFGFSSTIEQDLLQDIW